MTAGTLDASTVQGATICEYSAGPQRFNVLTVCAGQTTANTITVDPVEHLTAGLQTITGGVTGPSRAISRYWYPAVPVAWRIAPSGGGAHTVAA